MRSVHARRRGSSGTPDALQTQQADEGVGCRLGGLPHFECELRVRARFRQSSTPPRVNTFVIISL